MKLKSTLIVVIFALCVAATPFQDFKPEKIEKIGLESDLFFELEDGDWVHPTFSPDSKYLVYSGVRIIDGTEFTDIKCLELESRKITTLIDAEQAKKYAEYKTFIFDISWKTQDEILFYFSDGDVGATEVKYDWNNKKIVSEHWTEGDAEYEATYQEKINTPVVKSFFDHCRKNPSVFFNDDISEEEASSYFNERMLTSAINRTFLLEDKGLINQWQYTQTDRGIRYYDHQQNKVVKLMDISGNKAKLVDFEAKDGDAFFTLKDGDKYFLFKFETKGNKIKLIHEGDLMKGAYPIMKLAHLPNGKAQLMVLSGVSYAQNDNVLFEITDSNNIKQIDDQQKLYDFTISPDGKMTAYVVWKGDKRMIQLRKNN